MVYPWVVDYFCDIRLRKLLDDNHIDIHFCFLNSKNCTIIRNVARKNFCTEFAYISRSLFSSLNEYTYKTLGHLIFLSKKNMSIDVKLITPKALVKCFWDNIHEDMIKIKQ